MSYFEVLILSVIEGLTEFIPVSSTGHLILASALLKIESTDFMKAFEVIIQFGAILAVFYLYRSRLKWNFEFYRKVTLAFLPTAVLGFILKNKALHWIAFMAETHFNNRPSQNDHINAHK